MITEMTQAIELISEQLGIVGERIFGIFTEAQAIAGILDILVMVASLVVPYLICKRIITRFGLLDKAKHIAIDDDDPMLIFGICMIAILVVLLLAVVTGAVAHDIAGGVLKILCPEYTAMKEIIDLVMVGGA